MSQGLGKEESSRSRALRPRSASMAAAQQQDVCHELVVGDHLALLLGTCRQKLQGPYDHGYSASGGFEFGGQAKTLTGRIYDIIYNASRCCYGIAEMPISLRRPRPSKHSPTVAGKVTYFLIVTTTVMAVTMAITVGILPEPTTSGSRFRTRPLDPRNHAGDAGLSTMSWRLKPNSFRGEPLSRSWSPPESLRFAVQGEARCFATVIERSPSSAE